MTAYFDDDLLGGQRDPNAIQKAIAQATGQGFGDPDPAFQQLVVTALLKKGLDYSAIPPAQLNDMVRKLWNNPVLQDEWNAENNLDPSDPNFITAAQFETQVNDALFSPSNSPDPDLAQIGVNLLASQHRALSAEQQAFMVTGVGNASDVRNIIIQVAQSLGVDPALALAIADQESGLNPNAIGDDGHSVGLFQLHDQGEGAGMTVAEREDPRRNAEIALSVVAQVAAAHPDWSPGQIAAAAQRPADQASYAQSVDAIYGEVRAGKLPSPKYGQAPGAAGVAALSAQYPGVESAFESYFHRKPTFGELSSLVGLNAQQLEDRLRSLPSHIPGLNMGQYDDLRKLADNAMMAGLGHLATDGIVAQLHNDGHTTKAEVEHYINHLAESALATVGGAQTYNSIYAANKPAMTGIYQEQGFDPRIAVEQHQQTQQDDPTSATSDTEAAAVADRLPVPGLEFDPNQNRQPFAPGIADTPPPTQFQQGAGHDASGDFAA